MTVESRTNSGGTPQHNVGSMGIYATKKDERAMVRRTLQRCWLPQMRRSCPMICVFVRSSWTASASSINSMSRTNPKCRQRRSEHAVTIVAAVIFAVFCSVFAAAAAQHAQASGAVGTWSTSRLHLARGFWQLHRCLIAELQCLVEATVRLTLAMVV